MGKWWDISALPESLGPVSVLLLTNCFIIYTSRCREPPLPIFFFCTIEHFCLHLQTLSFFRILCKVLTFPKADTFIYFLVYSFFENFRRSCLFPTWKQCFLNPPPFPSHLLSLLPILPMYLSELHLLFFYLENTLNEISTVHMLREIRLSTGTYAAFVRLLPSPINCQKLLS